MHFRLYSLLPLIPLSILEAVCRGIQMLRKCFNAELPRLIIRYLFSMTPLASTHVAVRAGRAGTRLLDLLDLT